MGEESAAERSARYSVAGMEVGRRAWHRDTQMRRTSHELSANISWERSVWEQAYYSYPQSGVSNTEWQLSLEMWWIPKLYVSNYVKIVINKCNVCKLYSTKPFEAPITAEMPSFRTEGDRPFEVTGVDFAGPLYYKITKKEDGKSNTAEKRLRMHQYYWNLQWRKFSVGGQSRLNFRENFQISDNPPICTWKGCF